MKRTLPLLILAALALASCQNPADTQKLVSIGELGLQVLQTKKVITAEQAALARQTGQILITPAAAAPSGK